MRRIGILIVVLAFTALSSCAGLSPEGELGPTGDADVASGHLRVVKVFERPWEVDCSGEECGSATLASFDTPLPQGVESFDVTVTVTLDFAPSRALPETTPWLGPRTPTLSVAPGGRT